MQQKSKVLSLYRHLLRTVRTFPSKKRASIREDICITFRERRGMSDPGELALAWESGVRGLETMTKYTSLDKSSSNWSVTLDQAPLGEGVRAVDSAFVMESNSPGVNKLSEQGTLWWCT